MVSGTLPLAGTQVRTGPAAFDPATFAKAARSPREPVTVIFDSRKSRFGVLLADAADGPPDSIDATVTAVLPALYPEWLGDRTFCETHGVRFPYVIGSMANGIATVRLVVETARAGFLGFFGAAGLAPARVEDALASCPRAGARFLVGLEPHPLPARAGARGGDRRALPAAGRAAGRGLGVHGAHARRGALRGGGAHRRRRRTRAAQAPPLREDLAARDGAVLPRPGPAGDARRAGRGGQLTRAEADLAGACRWPKTSPPRPTPAATPTTGR